METSCGPIAETWEQAGVERIYRIVSDNLNGPTGSFQWQGKIEWVHVHQEEVTALPQGPRRILRGLPFIMLEMAKPLRRPW